MRQDRRPPVTLQLSLLVVAVLLEVAANFAANAGDGSWFAQFMQVIAGPALVVLLVVLVAGNALVLWWENPHTARPRWNGGRSPYPGLAAFEEQDAAVFFGREGQVADLVRRLHQTNAKSSTRLVCVTGPSGSGKSSLVHAGVVPRLRTHRWKVLPSIVPAGEPLGGLASMAATLTGADRAVLLREFRYEPDGLARALAAWRGRSGNRYGRVLLVVDQLEELVTLSGPAERTQFLDQIAHAMSADLRLWVVATLRVEFLAELLAGDHAALFAAPVTAGALRPAEMLSVVEEPARLAGMGFEDGLVAEIVADTGTADALPLLAYLLQELYFSAGPDRVASRQMYQALGGVPGALGRQADAVFAGLRDRYEPEVILSALLRLVSMDGAEPTRRRVRLEELSTDERRIVEVFTDARLLTTDAAGAEPYVQVAHEALFRQWAPLRQEVETRAEQLKRRTELERWASEWIGSGRSPDYLLTGDRLELAGQWLKAIQSAGQDTLSARELVDASRRYDTAFLRRVSESVGHYALTNVDRYPELAVLLTTAALTECPTTPVAQRALMSALAFNHLDMVLSGHTDAVRGVAWSPDGRTVATASRDGTARLWDVDTGTVTHVLRGHTGMVEDVAWSPDSARIATASRDSTIRVWDTATADPVTVLSCGDYVRGVAWSPDGTYLAGTSRDHTVHTWDTATWTAHEVLAGHTADVWGVRFSPDSTRLATASHDQTVIVWNLTTGQPSVVLRGHLDFVEAVAWSPDGQWIATGSGDHTVRIWNAADGGQHRSIGSNRQPIWSISWTPDGERVVFALGDGTARVWDTTRLREVAELRGHEQTAWSVAISPDGTRALTGSGDTTGRIWNLHPHGAEKVLLAGHLATVTAVDVSAKGDIVTGTADARLHSWHADGTPHRRQECDAPVVAVACSPTSTVVAVALQNGSTVLRNAAGGEVTLVQRLPVECLAFSPDGARLALGAKDNSIHIYDLRTRTAAGTLRGHADWIGALAWSPSGRYLASGSDDRTLRVWDIESPTNSMVFAGHQNYIDGVCWSPDERSLASCSADWTIRIWDLAHDVGGPVQVLTGHDRRVRAVGWSSDGRHLASASDDHTVRIWEPHSNRSSQVIGVHRDAVTCLAWLPTGDRVVTGSADATARIWSLDVEVEELTRVARARVFRTLTPEERRAHMLPV